MGSFLQCFLCGAAISDELGKRWNAAFDVIPVERSDKESFTTPERLETFLLQCLVSCQFERKENFCYNSTVTENSLIK